MTKNNKPLFIIMAGLSGSGKGTQAELLKDKIDYEHIVMGDLLRTEAVRDTELGRKIHEIIHIKGELVPDHVSTKLLKNTFNEIDKSKNIVLDGFPRTLIQAGNLNKILEEIGIENYDLKVLHIKISDEEAIERLSKRRICPSCKEIYISNGNNAQMCKSCNDVELIMREDDQPEMIRKRLEWGHKDLDPVLEMYKEKGVLVLPISYSIQTGVSGDQWRYPMYKYWQGAFVFNINENEITLRGKIDHETNSNESYYYGPYTVERSLYMDNVLYTVSKSFVKANDLDSLDELNSVKLPYEVPDYRIMYGAKAVVSSVDAMVK